MRKTESERGQVPKGAGRSCLGEVCLVRGRRRKRVWLEGQLMDAVSRFLEAYPAAVQEMTQKLRKIITATLPRLREELDTKDRVIGYGLGPGYAGLVCTIDRKSTRLNSSHTVISYAVFCLKKKKKKK